jgi:hypothetical protein
MVRAGVIILSGIAWHAVCPARKVFWTMNKILKLSVVVALITLIACQAIYTAYHRIFAHGQVVEQVQHQ